MILGDSNTSQGEFDVKIEQSLIKSSGKNVSVIKIGIPSYNTSQEVELLKTKLIDLKPDFVVLQFTPNDFTITPVVVKIGNEMMYLSAQGEKRFLTNEFLYKNSKLYSSYILYRLLINNSGASDSKPDSLRWEQQVEAMKLTMQDFATFVKSNNIEALVLVYPIFDKDKGKTETEEIIRILSSNDIKYIDMTLVANKFGGPENFQQPVVEGDVDTIHPNRDWDDVVSDTLIEYIEVHTKLMLN